MATTPRPAYIWDSNSNDWAPLAGTIDTGQSYNFSAVQNFNAGVNAATINGGSVTGKNYLINGGFDFWQRGTSSSSQMGYYTADRWYTGGTGGTITVSQETTDLPAGVPVQYGIKWVTSAASSYATLYQAIESQVLKTILGRQVTVSGYIKVTGGYAGSMYAVLEYNTINDALLSSNTNVATGAAGNAVDAASWKRFSFTTTVPSNAAGLRVGLQPDLAQASGVTVRLTGLKLELGTVATLFSTAGSTLQQELAACQRYYYTLPYNYNAERGNPYTDFLIMNTADQTSWARGVVQFPVTMRTSPTLQAPTAANYYILGSAGVLSITSISIDNMTNASMAVVNAFRTGLSTGTTYFLRFAGNVTDYLRFSAEL